MSITTRAEQKPEDCWDLSSLYSKAEDWERDLEALGKDFAKIQDYRGRLAEGPAVLAELLELFDDIGLRDERLGYYAFLTLSEDGGDSVRQGRQGRYLNLASRIQTASSWFQPELLSLDQATIDSYLASPELAGHKISLEKTLRYKPHTLSAGEEKLLAMQSEANQTAHRSFGALTDVDMDFGTVKLPGGEAPLSQSSFIQFQLNPDRGVREEAFKKFYRVFDQHKNTLASLYLGSVQLDVYQARARAYPSSLEASLFNDKVAKAVYLNLIETVRSFLPDLHSYYGLRARELAVRPLELWDTKVSLIPDVKTRYTYEEAADLVLEALHPLGEEYQAVLGKGLRGGWVDRYENKGKRSGAFSAGSYPGAPYILMNYKEDVLGDVFTLAHEGGHSMHSWYSVRNNPFSHYNYSIFEAEVASTFNEQLLFYHLVESTEDKKLRAYLYNKQLDDIIGTIFRQTMFAEFELICHTRVEEGESLTLDDLRSEYRKLQEAYFGQDVNIDAAADLEGLRIPHFYRAFYVYKYATGLSAAMSLANRVRHGGAVEREEYLNFLKAGGSSYPIDSLRLAGVDMAKPEAIKLALGNFKELLKGFERSLSDDSRPQK